MFCEITKWKRVIFLESCLWFCFRESTIAKWSFSFFLLNVALKLERQKDYLKPSTSKQDPFIAQRRLLNWCHVSQAHDTARNDATVDKAPHKRIKSKKANIMSALIRRFSPPELL
jgi:hypothetical protein